MIRTSDGAVYYINSDGLRQYVPNSNIENCIRVRANVAGPFSVDYSTLDAYRSSPKKAYCPYEKEKYLNFVSADGNFVWLVEAGGIKHHVGTTCGGAAAYTDESPKWWKVHPIPVGETDGHEVGSDWFASDGTCAALAP